MRIKLEFDIDQGAKRFEKMTSEEVTRMFIREISTHIYVYDTTSDKTMSEGFLFRAVLTRYETDNSETP